MYCQTLDGCGLEYFSIVLDVDVNIFFLFLDKKCHIKFRGGISKLHSIGWAGIFIFKC